MKIAIWRYGLPVQTEHESTVGGGLLASMLLRALTQRGEVTVVGKASKGAIPWLQEHGIRCTPTTDLGAYDVGVVMTGPYNPLYGDAMFDTYRRIASLRGKAVYAQWDVALPYHFAPTGPRYDACALAPDAATAGKEWHLLTQLGEREARASKSKATAYRTFPFKHVRCVWELLEASKAPLPVQDAQHQAIAYFGSDRPGRMREIKRWFCAPNAPPVHLYGRWSKESLAQLTPNVAYRGPVAENDVTKLLNAYAMTFYMADPAYITNDFIAQRFLENATAGVPVFYSDKLQPTVAHHVPSDMVLTDPNALRSAYMLACACKGAARQALVESNRAVVRAFVEQCPFTLANALDEVFK